jgi:alcohol dehydrogenase (cytochrome c)
MGGLRQGLRQHTFSPLKAINTGNVSHLSLVYSFQLGSLRSNESTPLVIGDTV